MPDYSFTQLDSERLILRRFTYADLETFQAYRADPEVARYQDWNQNPRALRARSSLGGDGGS